MNLLETSFRIGEVASMSLASDSLDSATVEPQPAHSLCKYLGNCYTYNAEQTIISTLIMLCILQTRPKCR